MNMKPTAKPAPLGRGLSALFGDTDVSYRPLTVISPGPRHATPTSETAAAPASNEKITAPRLMPIDWIQPGALQPRRRFDDDALKGLADSIRERGILQPLLVRPVEGEKDAYELIAGERRWRAAQLAGVHDVPVVVRGMSDREALEIGLIENIQREDLSPIEEARGYKQLMEQYHHSQDGLAKVVGKHRSHISSMLRLLTLPQGVIDAVNDGSLTFGHARALITVPDPQALANEIMQKHLSVRQVEALAQQLNDGKFAKKQKPIKTGVKHNSDVNICALEKEIERVIGLKARIKMDSITKRTSGTLTFYFDTLDQFSGLMKRLKG